MAKTKTENIHTRGLMNGKKTDYGIPTFSFKSSLIILAGAIGGTLAIPFILSLLGVSYKLGVVIGNILVTGYAVAYTRSFIESKKGYCRSFWITYAGFGIALGIISAFWMYLEIYV